MENPIKMDDLGIPLFLETPMSTSKQTMSRQPHLKHFFKKEPGKPPGSMLSNKNPRWLGFSNHTIMMASELRLYKNYIFHVLS